MRSLPGRLTADLARKLSISEATWYNWRSKYGGTEVSDAQRLRMLKDENRKLKELSLDARQLCAEEASGKKW